MSKMPSFLLESMNVKLRELSRELSHTNSGTINIKIKAGACVKVMITNNHNVDGNIQSKGGLNIEAKKYLIELIESRVREHDYFLYGHINVTFKFEDEQFTQAQIEFAVENILK